MRSDFSLKIRTSFFSSIRTSGCFSFYSLFSVQHANAPSGISRRVTTRQSSFFWLATSTPVVTQRISSPFLSSPLLSSPLACDFFLLFYIDESSACTLTSSANQKGWLFLLPSHSDALSATSETRIIVQVKKKPSCQDSNS